MFIVSEAWKKEYPNAALAAMLLSSVTAVNTVQAKPKEEIQHSLRSRFAKLSQDELDRSEPVKAYQAYYRRFNRFVDMRFCLESLLQQEKPRTPVHPVIEAVLTASMDNLIFTSCHDRDRIHTPFSLHTAQPGTSFVPLAGRERELTAGDMVVSDSQGVLAGMLDGGNQPSRVQPDTHRFLILAFAPPGLSRVTVCRHLLAVHSRIRSFAPETEINFFQYINK